MTEVKISNYKMNVFFNEKTIRFIVEANIISKQKRLKLLRLFLNSNFNIYSVYIFQRKINKADSII